MDFDNGGMDYDDYEDDEWIYMEDGFSLSDELAETQVPEPGYCGTNWEIEQEIDDDFDVYNYWVDLKYLEDAYWEEGSSRAAAKRATASIRGQKRPMHKAGQGTDKRRKTGNKAAQYPNVFNPDAEVIFFLSQKERDRRFRSSPPLLASTVPYALLPDWRERFASKKGVLSAKPMPTDMKDAAEGRGSAEPVTHEPASPAMEEDIRASKRGPGMDGADASDGGLHDDDDSVDATGEDGDDDEAPDIDPDMLKTILRQKLGAAGLEGMDESMFMEAIQQMISGEGDMDSATGGLASSLLGKVTGENGDAKLTGWLSNQGVSLQDGEDDASSVASEAQAGPSATPAVHKPLVHDLRANSASVSARLHGIKGVNSLAPAQKRKAPSDRETGTARKRLNVEILEQKDARRDSKALHDTTEQPETTSKLEAISTNDTVEANGVNGQGEESGLMEGTANASDAARDSTKPKAGRKRKAADVDKAAGPASGAKRTRKATEEANGAVLESTPVSRRTRNASAKGKGKT